MATTDIAFRWLTAALEPVASASTDDDAIAFVEQLGWTLPVVPGGWRDLANATDDLLAAFATVIDAHERGDDETTTRTNIELAVQVVVATDAIARLGERVRDELPAAYVTATRIDDELVPRLYAFLVERFLHTHTPRAHAILSVLGVIEVRAKAADASLSQPAYTHVEIHWARLPALLSDPAQWAREVYGWGTDTFDTARLFATLLRLSYFLAAPGEIHYPSASELALLAGGAPLVDAVAPELWLPVWQHSTDRIDLVLTPIQGSPSQLALGLALRGSVDAEIALRPGVTIAFSGGGQIVSRAAVVLVPSATPRLVGADPDLAGRIGIELRIRSDAGPLPLLSLGEYVSLDVEQICVAVGAEVRDHSTDAMFEIAFVGARLAMSGGGHNGLVATLLPPPGVEVRFDARLVWSVTRGVHFAGTASLELAIPVTASFGPVRLRQIAVAIEPDTDEVGLAARVAIGLALGPLTLDVDGIGLRAVLRFAPGNLGAADLAVSFAPPRGLSIAVDAGPVYGGGRLEHDPATGRYAGALAVRVFTVEAAAFGILDTRPPGGGFSFVAAIGTRFPSIPLGLGFTLDGIGGLLGVNRRLDVDAARAAVRSGGIAALLSTDDPIARAPEVLQTLGTMFPASHGRYILGPSVRLGWGSPKLVTADLALLLEVPSPIRIVLLGALRIALPTMEQAVVDLRLDVLGVLDLGRGTLSIDASLHDSTIAGYAITGDMAVRIGWLSDPQLLVSIGGFHPAFRPPAGFTTPRRLQLVAGDNPQLTFAGYLAVTSNTAQFGAHAELLFKGGGFEIGGHVNFDALFEFLPFHFEIDIDASASIKYHSISLTSVKLELVLSGPHPWHAAGEATFGVLWWDVSVSFDETWGDLTDLLFPSLPDIVGALLDALGQREAWSAGLAPGEPTWIVPRTDSATNIRVHPLARVVVRQQVVPFSHDITQFGSIPLETTQRFAVERVTLDTSTTALTVRSVDDRFAPGQFTRLETTERLSAPAFEQFASGVELGANELAYGEAARVAMEVATRVVDPLAPPARPPIRSVDAAIVRGARATQAVPLLVDRGPRVVDLDYVLASTQNLEITAEGAALGRGARRYASLREALRPHTNARRRLQVVPRIEAPNHESRIVLVREDENLRNVDYVDTLTGVPMTREQLVEAIHAHAYPDFVVRTIRGIATPVARVALADDAPR